MKTRRSLTARPPRINDLTAPAARPPATVDAVLRARRAACKTIAACFAASGPKMRYYSPDVHAASFAPPPYICELAE